jgi:hypothetical protein
MTAWTRFLATVTRRPETAAAAGGNTNITNTPNMMKKELIRAAAYSGARLLVDDVHVLGGRPRGRP